MTVKSRKTEQVGIDELKPATGRKEVAMMQFDFFVFVEEYPQMCESSLTREGALAIAWVFAKSGLRGVVSQTREDDVYDIATFDYDNGVVELDAA